MRTIKASLLAATLAGITSASAAELPVKAPTMPVKGPPIPPSVIGIPVSPWSGFYLGGTVGYGFTQSNSETTHLPSQVGFGADPFGQSTRPKGYMAGVTAGYNIQSGQVIYGIELDWSYANLRGSGTLAPLPLLGGAPDPGSSQAITSKLDWLATGRLRLGFDIGNMGFGGSTLIFLSGGYAAGHVKHRIVTDYVGDTLRFPGDDSKMQYGLTGGGGFEMGFSPNWTFKAEYLYFDLGRQTVTASPVAPNPPFEVRTDVNLRNHLVRVGMNYRFGNDAPTVRARN